MLRDEDLSAAVKAGVITAEQKAALEGQAASRHAARPFAAGRDERFRFLRGFNDVFLALGVVLVTGAFLTQWSPQLHTGAPVLLLGAAVLWGISELLVARHKAVLPGMVAVLCIGLLCGIAGAQWATVNGVDAVSTKPTYSGFSSLPFNIWLAGAGAGCLSTLLFYVRFRLPFALLPLGIGIMATVLLAIVNRYGFDTTQSSINAAALIMGITTFALAMRFDSTDPERLTRRSDCGFWLHLAAAPFIVHPTIATLVGHDSQSAALLTILLVALMGAVALLVDRRALLVSSLTYFGFAVAYLVRHTAITDTLTLTLGLLGLFVIFMGLGWHRLRRLILNPFAGASWLKYLPPAQPS